MGSNESLHVEYAWSVYDPIFGRDVPSSRDRYLELPHNCGMVSLTLGTEFVADVKKQVGCRDTADSMLV